jgi:hypothetical protein
MQVFVEVPPDVTEWFERIEDSSSLRDLVRLTRKCVVIANQAGDRRALLKSVSRIESEAVKGILAAFVTSLPANWHAGDFVGSVRIGSLGDDLVTFDRLKEAGLFDALEDGNFDIIPGTTREVAFEDNFAALAKVANSVEIFDPYLSRHVVDGLEKTKDKLWWLTKLLENNELNVTIISACPKERHPRLFTDNLRKSVESLVAMSSKRQGIVRIETFEENSSIFHNRTLRFIFDQNDFALESNNSFDRFSSSPITQRLSLKRVSSSVLSNDFNFYKLKLKQHESILLR